MVALLVAAACGGGNAPAPAVQASTATPTATALPSATPSPSPTPSPVATPEAASNYFRPVAGYEWVTPPTEVQVAVVKAFSDPSIAPYFGGAPEVRLVTQRGDPTSLLLLALPLAPSYAALPKTLDSIVTGYGAVAAPQVLTIGGRRAVLLLEDQKYTFKSLVWQQRAFVLWLYGFNGVSSETMTSLAQAVIAANQQ